MDVVALIGLLSVGFLWRATTSAGVADLAITAIVVVPLTLGVGVARDSVAVAVAATTAFAVGYAIAWVLPRARTSPAPLRD